jgi:hypothetical protein
MVATSSTLWMMKMPAYQVVRMIAVRNRLMPTSGAMVVPSGMGPAIVFGLT